MKTENQNRISSVKIQLSFLLIVTLTISAAFCLAFWHQHYFTESISDPRVLIPEYRWDLIPKPTERFVFIVLVFVVPILAFLWTVKTTGRSIVETTVFVRIVENTLPIILAVVFFVPFIGFDFTRSRLMEGRSMPPDHPLRYLAICLFCSIGLLVCHARGIRLSARAAPIVKGTIWLVFICSMLLQICAWRVLGEASLTTGPEWETQPMQSCSPYRRLRRVKQCFQTFHRNMDYMASFLDPSSGLSRSRP